MIQPIQPIQLRDKKGKPVHWEGAITKLFTGIAFLIISIALAFSQMGRGWWFWMLIPAFGALGSGVARIIQLRKVEKGNFLIQPQQTENTLPQNYPNAALPANQTEFIQIQNLVHSGNKTEAIKVHRETFGSSLKDAKAAVERIERGGEISNQPQVNSQSEYVAPPRGSIYDTGELEIPPSVVEGTTRHLEINKEGETMTLPPKK